MMFATFTGKNLTLFGLYDAAQLAVLRSSSESSERSAFILLLVLLLVKPLLCRVELDPLLEEVVLRFELRVAFAYPGCAAADSLEVDDARDVCLVPVETLAAAVCSTLVTTDCLLLTLVPLVPVFGFWG